MIVRAQSLARLGASTLGIDATPSNIPLAQTHQLLDAFLTSPPPASHPDFPRLEYRHQTAEDLLQNDGGEAAFDVVCAMEVLEHVDDPKGFLLDLTKLVKVSGDFVHYGNRSFLLYGKRSRVVLVDPLCRLVSPIPRSPSPRRVSVEPLSHHYSSWSCPSQPGGHLVLSTISRTPLAHLLTITFAETLLRLVSPGTHTSSKFVKPSELDAFFDSIGWNDSGIAGYNGASGVRESRGIIYVPWKGKWELVGRNVGEAGKAVNFLYYVRRPKDA